MAPEQSNFTRTGNGFIVEGVGNFDTAPLAGQPDFFIGPHNLETLIAGELRQEGLPARFRVTFERMEDE